MEKNGQEVLVFTYNKESGDIFRFSSEAAIAFADSKPEMETNFMSCMNSEY
jgi:hypothetical protein